MRVRLGSPLSMLSKGQSREAIASRLSASGWPRNLTGWHLTGVALVFVVLLTVALVLTWGDTPSFPKVLDKEVPTSILSVSTDLEQRLERSIIPDELRQGLKSEGVDLSDNATVSTVEEGSKWLISEPSKKYAVIKEQDGLAINGEVLIGTLQFQEELDTGTISKDLREGFGKIQIGLSDNATVSTLEQGSVWLITDPIKDYDVTREGNNLVIKTLQRDVPRSIFSFNTKLDQGLETGVISRDLRRAFSGKGAGLSDLATISTMNEGGEWLITDPERIFEVVKEGSKLNIGGGLLNVSSEQYQVDFETGIISENLLEGFQFYDIGLSDSVKVSTKEEGRLWLITDPVKNYAVSKQEYLNVGDVPVQVNTETQVDLDNSRISENLRIEFRRKEIFLSDNATVSPVEGGNRWLITDLDLATTHTVTIGEDQLNIDEIEQRGIFLNEDIADGIDTATGYVTTEGDVVFDFIGDVIKQVLTWIEDTLLWLPYPVLIAGIALLAWRMAGLGVALFSGGSLLSIGFVGLWPSAMETLSLMLTSVAIATLIAVPIGIIAARSNAVDAALRPLLDGMQTMPAFVYLVPAIFFFGLGNVPAVIATIIYAVPPGIRLTNLGIRQVSPETLEAARAFGATPLQLLFKVQIPLALPTIMAGINQTTMLALAMVVTASLVGAGGLGADVLKAIGRLQIGNSLLAGMSIVFLAIMIDRITQGFATAQAKATQE